MIGFPCPGCGAQLKVKDELAGKRGKCPSCGKRMTVPADPSATAVPARRKGGRPGDSSPQLSPDPQETTPSVPQGDRSTTPAKAAPSKPGRPREHYSFLRP